MLQQLVQIYAPSILKLFQKEYDLYVTTCIKNTDENKSLWEYVVSLLGKERDHIMSFDPCTKAIACNCKKFEIVGILVVNRAKTCTVKN